MEVVMILYEIGDISIFGEEREKTKWPFYRMAIGQCFFIYKEDRKRAQLYVHSYGKGAKMKFKTKTDKDGNLLVLRIS